MSFLLKTWIITWSAWLPNFELWPTLISWDLFYIKQLGEHPNLDTQNQWVLTELRAFLPKLVSFFFFWSFPLVLKQNVMFYFLVHCKLKIVDQFNLFSTLQCEGSIQNNYLIVYRLNKFLRLWLRVIKFLNSNVSLILPKWFVEISGVVL